MFFLVVNGNLLGSILRPVLGTPLSLWRLVWVRSQAGSEIARAGIYPIDHI
jgi:hypothetical protein